IAAAQSPRGPALLQPGVAHAAGRGGEPRPGLVRGSGQSARVPRTHRSPARAGAERAGIFGQPRAHALHARGAGDAQRGEKRETIDAAAETFGMPMGPIELADTVGLDICLHVAETLKASLDRPMPDVSRVLRDKVEMGHLGRKSGRGFYEWRRGKAVKEREAPKPTAEMTDRLILPMLDVCGTCLRESGVADEGTLDGA